jgi:RNA polymerase sigma-70 factor (ECF subfamily)
MIARAEALLPFVYERGTEPGRVVTDELLSEISADAVVYRLYMAHLIEVRRYVSSLVPLSDVDDIVADTFALALAKSHKIPEGIGLAWLLKSARYLANNHLRRQRHREISLEDETGSLQLRHSADDIAASDLASVVISAMDQLPPKEREAVMLYTFDQLDVRTCAKIAGCTPQAYATRLHRGKAKLRQLLAQLDPSLGGETND